MSAHAGHAHAGHGHVPASSQKLAIAFYVSLGVLALEVAGGIASGSLALLSDAGHVLTDVLAIALAWFASAQAERPPNARHTYGLHRAGILAAFVNALTLVGIAVWVTYEAAHRLFDPHPVETGLMLGVAVLGLAANLGVAWYLRAPGAANLNVRAALAHVMGDALASAAVIAGAVAIALGGPEQIDPLLSVLISVIIVVGGWGIVRESLNILMEGTPPGVDVERLVADLGTLPSVLAVHDIHVWRLTSDLPALSVHVRAAAVSVADEDQVLGSCQRLLAERYGITHTTIQVEREAAAAACPPAPHAGASAYCAGPRGAVAGTGPAEGLAGGPSADPHGSPGVPHAHAH